eukprot:5182688-Amphidinium_carterae.1
MPETLWAAVEARGLYHREPDQKKYHRFCICFRAQSHVLMSTGLSAWAVGGGGIVALVLPEDIKSSTGASAGDMQWQVMERFLALRA